MTQRGLLLLALVLSAFFAGDDLIGSHLGGVFFEFDGEVEGDLGVKGSDESGSDLDLDIVAHGAEGDGALVAEEAVESGVEGKAGAIFSVGGLPVHKSVELSAGHQDARAFVLEESDDLAVARAIEVSWLEVSEIPSKDLLRGDNGEAEAVRSVVLPTSTDSGEGVEKVDAAAPSEGRGSRDSRKHQCFVLKGGGELKDGPRTKVVVGL